MGLAMRFTLKVVKRQAGRESSCKEYAYLESQQETLKTEAVFLGSSELPSIFQPERELAKVDPFLLMGKGHS